MSPFSELLPTSVVNALGWTLLHATWQGVAVALLTALSFYAARHQKSALRYWMGVGALASQVALSIVTYGIYFQPTSPMVAVAAPQVVTQTVATTTVGMGIPWYLQFSSFIQTHFDLLVTGWMLGTAVLLVRMLGSWWYVQQLRRRDLQPATHGHQERLNRLVGALGIRRPVTLLESARVAVPMVAGFLKPVILLPVGLATGLTTKQIEAILAHELAHVKRFDYVVNLLQTMVEAVYFFHPALWWVSGRLRTERENCCDDVALQLTNDPLAFAQALAHVEQFRQQTPALAMAFTGPKNQLLQRVRRVLGVQTPSAPNSQWVGALLMVLLVGISVYAVKPTVKDKPKAATKKMMLKNNDHLAFDGDFRLTNGIWQGKVLNKKELAEVNQEWQLVKENRRDLSTVPPKYRSLLQEMKTKHDALGKGMDALAKGLSMITEETVEIRTDTVALVERQVEVLEERVVTNELSAKYLKESDFHEQKLEALATQMQPINEKMEALSKEMEKHHFAIEAAHRQLEVMHIKRSRAYDERSQVLEQRSQLMGKSSKLSEAEMDKLMADFEQKIKAKEQVIEALDKQVDELDKKADAARAPVDEIQKKMEPLQKQIAELSEQMSEHSMAISKLYPAPPPPPGPYRMRAPRMPRAPRPASVRVPSAPRPVPAPAAPAPVTAPTPPKKK